MYYNILRPAAKKFTFFLKIKKYLECSETIEYAKVFCGIFARVSVKNIFQHIFPLEPTFFFFFQSHPFQAFLVSKIYVHWKTVGSCEIGYISRIKNSRQLIPQNYAQCRINLHKACLKEGCS